MQLVPVDCPWCGDTIETVSKLERHLDTWHYRSLGDLPGEALAHYHCLTCGEEYSAEGRARSCCQLTQSAYCTDAECLLEQEQPRGA